MKISGIMDIQALAGNRKLKSETDISEARNRENIRKNFSATAQGMVDVSDRVWLETKDRVPLTDVKKEGQVVIPVNGGVVDVQT